MDGQEQSGNGLVKAIDIARVAMWNDCSLLLFIAVETPKPKVIEDRDVILRVTGSTICGSDLHLYHGTLGFLSPSWKSLTHNVRCNRRTPEG